MTAHIQGVLKADHIRITGTVRNGDTVKLNLSKAETVQAGFGFNAGTAYICAELTGDQEVTIRTNNLVAGTAYVTAWGRV